MRGKKFIKRGHRRRREQGKNHTNNFKVCQRMGDDKSLKNQAKKARVSHPRNRQVKDWKPNHTPRKKRENGRTHQNKGQALKKGTSKKNQCGYQSPRHKICDKPLHLNTKDPITQRKNRKMAPSVFKRHHKQKRPDGKKSAPY